MYLIYAEQRRDKQNIILHVFGLGNPNFIINISIFQKYDTLFKTTCRDLMIDTISKFHEVGLNRIIILKSSQPRKISSKFQEWKWDVLYRQV